MHLHRHIIQELVEVLQALLIQHSFSLVIECISHFQLHNYRYRRTEAYYLLSLFITLPRYNQ